MTFTCTSIYRYILSTQTFATKNEILSELNILKDNPQSPDHKVMYRLYETMNIISKIVIANDKLKYLRMQINITTRR